MEPAPRPPRDWFKFWLHFFCGGVMGALLTAAAVAKSSRIDHWSRGDTAAVLAVALGAALLAAFRTDDFWDDLAPWLNWGIGGDADARARCLEWLLLAAAIGVAALVLDAHLGWIGNPH
jgi:hypothetical protein